MIRNPDIPLSEPKEFDPETFAIEKDWLERIQQGKIIVSHTKGGLFLALGTALIVAVVIGGSIGAIITIFTKSFFPVIIAIVLVFVIAAYLLKGDYSRLEIDPESKKLLYEGAVSFGGELRTIRYRGPIEVVEATYLVRLRRAKFIPFFKIYTQPFIRLVTRSGYLRVSYQIEEEHHFLSLLENLGLIDLELMESSLLEDPIRVEDDYEVYFEKRFDRSEFFAEFKKQKDEEKKLKIEKQKLKRQELLDKSKNLKKNGSD